MTASVAAMVATCYAAYHHVAVSIMTLIVGQIEGTV
jgi:hypothetical protein